MTRKRFVKICRGAGYSEGFIRVLIVIANKCYKSYEITFEVFARTLAKDYCRNGTIWPNELLQEMMKWVPIEESAGFEADWPWDDDDQTEEHI